MSVRTVVKCDSCLIEVATDIPTYYVSITQKSSGPSYGFDICRICLNTWKLHRTNGEPHVP